RDFMLERSMDDPLVIGRIFMPDNMKHLIYQGNLAYVTPPPSPEKPLRIKAAPSARKIETPEIPSSGQGLRPGFRSGDSLLGGSELGGSQCQDDAYAGEL